VTEEGDEAWRRSRIELGVPTIFPATSDIFVPQMCNTRPARRRQLRQGLLYRPGDRRRLHYLGQLKRRMFRARSAAPAHAGQALFDARGDTQAVGEVVDAVADDAGSLLLAVLQLSHAGGDLRLDSPRGAR